MIELKGRYATAKVYTDNIETEAISQIVELCSQDFLENKKVAIMPDCHAGKGCVIGFTANLGDKVIPNLVGVDIGCGITVINLGNEKIDLEVFDKLVHSIIPTSSNVHSKRHAKFDLKNLHCFQNLKDTKRIECSIGTLGGGNHYLELSIDENDNKYLSIHSGSRNLGKQVADYYQNLAIKLRSSKEGFDMEKEKLIQNYKKQGRKKEIQAALKKLEKQYQDISPKYPDDLCYLDGTWKDKYLDDMKLCQEFASLNRAKIAQLVLNNYFSPSKQFFFFETIHNYIDFKDNIIRKGSVSAYNGEKFIVPINMRDGSLICIGKGNPDWNFSAPHGAGRLMSRSQAKKTLNLKDYQEQMNGIYTTCVNQSTLDEAPMAYKPMEEIIENIKDTAEIISIIKPIYNFKG